MITKYGESPNRSPNLSQNLSPNTLGLLYVDRTVMEELAKGFDENAVDPNSREEGTLLSQTVIDDMEDMFA